MSTTLTRIEEVLAGAGLRLHKAVPRGFGHLLLETRRSDRSMVAAQWFADTARAERVAAATRTGDSGDAHDGVRRIPGSGVVLQPDGADRLLPALSELVELPGSSLVAHRPERRGVVCQQVDGRVTYTKVVRRDRVHGVLAALRIPEISGVGGARVISVDHQGATICTEALPGRLFVDLLGDSRVPTAQLACAARAVGAAMARLHATPAPTEMAHHDAAAELSTTLRWWMWAAHHTSLDPGGPVPRDRFAAARRLLAGPPASSTCLHRDLHDRQLLVTSRGEVGLLDFDLAAVGEPALDLANLLVHLELRARQGHCSWERARLGATAILAGYQPAPEVAIRLPGYVLTTRLRLAAVYSFRPAGRLAAHDLMTTGLDLSPARGPG